MDFGKLEKFKKYHNDSPQIYNNIVQMARQKKTEGFSAYSIRTIWEVLRWNSEISGKDAYKLNNNYVPYYARLIMQNEPDLAGFFEVRFKPDGCELTT